MERSSENLSIISSQIVVSDSKRKAFLFLFGAVVLVEIVVGLYFVPKLIFSITSRQGKISELTEQVNDLGLQTRVVDSLDSQQVFKDYNSASLALPTEKKVSGIVSSLTALASSSGIVVSLLELTPCKISTRAGMLAVGGSRTTDCQNVQLGNGVNGVNLSMNLLADRNQLQEFVDKLYHVSPMLGVREFVYSSNPRGETANLGVLLYFQPTATLASGSAGKVSGISSDEEKILKALTSQLVILP